VWLSCAFCEQKAGEVDLISSLPLGAYILPHVFKKLSLMRRTITESFIQPFKAVIHANMIIML